MAGDQLGASANQLAANAMEGSRFNDLERNLIERNAQQLGQGRERMQALGLASQGMGQSPALAALENNNAASLRNDLTNLEVLRGQEGRADLEAAGQAAGLSTDIFNQTRINPVLQLVSSLTNPQNLQSLQYQDALERSAQLAQGVALGSRKPSDATTLAPIAGGAISGIGSIIGGALS